jgi:hypothetical protein
MSSTSAALAEPQLRSRDNMILVSGAQQSMWQYLHSPVFPHATIWQSIKPNTGVVGWGETVSLKPRPGVGDGLWRTFGALRLGGIAGVDVDSTSIVGTAKPGGGTYALADGVRAALENTSNATVQPHWVNAAGCHAIAEAQVSINGICFNQLWGRYLQAFNEVFGTEGNMHYELNGTHEVDKLCQLSQKSQIVYAPLCFFFDRHPSLMLVLEAMHFADIEFQVKFAQLSDMIVKPTATPTAGYQAGQEAWSSGRYLLVNRPDNVTWDKVKDLTEGVPSTFKFQMECVYVILSAEEGADLSDASFRQIIPAVQRRVLTVPGTQSGGAVKADRTSLNFRGNVRSILVNPISANAAASKDWSNKSAGWDLDGPASTNGRELVPNYVLNNLTLYSGNSMRESLTGRDLHAKNCQVYGRRTPDDHYGLLSWQTEYHPHQNTGALCATRADEMFVEMEIHPGAFLPGPAQSSVTVEFYADVWITIIYEDGFISLAFASFY